MGRLPSVNNPQERSRSSSLDYQQGELDMALQRGLAEPSSSGRHRSLQDDVINEYEDGNKRGNSGGAQGRRRSGGGPTRESGDYVAADAPSGRSHGTLGAAAVWYRSVLHGFLFLGLFSYYS